MARVRALLWVLTATARSAALHAAQYGPPPAASTFFSTPAAAASRGFSAPAAASRCFTAPAAASRAFTSNAAASMAPTAASKAVIGSDVAAVGVDGSGGPGHPFRRLGYGALATFAGAAFILISEAAPIPEWDLVDEEMEAEFSRLKDPSDDWIMYAFPGGIPSTSTTARAMRQNTAALKHANRHLKELQKIKKDQLKELQKKGKDSFWSLVEELIKKGQILLSAVSVVKETYAVIASAMSGSILLIEKYGDPTHYFVCPFSGYTEMVYMFLFTITPKDESQQGGASTGGDCLDNNKRLIHFSAHEAYDKTIGSFLPKGHPLRKGYANIISGEPPVEELVFDVGVQQFYGEGYDDSDKRISVMTLINKQLGWKLMRYQQKKCNEAETQKSKASASC